MHVWDPLPDLDRGGCLVDADSVAWTMGREYDKKIWAERAALRETDVFDPRRKEWVPRKEE
jgi:hypothetical protein